MLGLQIAGGLFPAFVVWGGFGIGVEQSWTRSQGRITRLAGYEKIGFVMRRMKFRAAGLFLTSAFVFLPAHDLFGGNTKTAEKAGAILFRDKGCVQCHGVGGVGGVPGKNAPSLVGIRNDPKWTPAKMTDQILNGGQKMPPFSDSVTDAEAAELIAYLRARHRPIAPPPPPGTTAPAAPPTK